MYKYSGGQDDIAAIRIKKAKKSYSNNSLTTNSCANYTWKFRRPCKVLIFNGARVLVAIVCSLHSAAELTHENKSAIKERKSRNFFSLSHNRDHHHFGRVNKKR
ncbi:MAG: hypothetical protein E7146_02255 [Rikenellaceae bacterium]|nr:hypothetical protein [Rikenellaceae bacterium]